MNCLIILFISAAALILGYIFYGAYVAKQLGIDPRKKTPAHTLEDGQDYIPSLSPVLMGHHFASIAGAGPINGPIQAAVFGWVPVLLWILVGGIFFGAVHDFASLFASIRHKGRSIGYIIEKNLGISAKLVFLIFAYLTLILIIGSFTSIVVDTFTGLSEFGAKSPANAAAGTISLWFILASILFGEIVYRRNLPLSASNAIGIAAIILCIAVGIKYPLFLKEGSWQLIVLVYIFVASVSPIWLLLQPRDYLNSFLLYAMIIASVLGIIVSHPSISIPAFAGFKGINGNGMLFPMLFSTVACGALSGFHSLVGSGTTSKQINKETDAKAIGYGGMLIESMLAVTALIAAGVFYGKTGNLDGTPMQIFSASIASMINAFGFKEAYAISYSLIILSVSAFCLTSLDTATRLARYMLQEIFVTGVKDIESLTGVRKICANSYFATFVTVVLGGLLSLGGYGKIWPLFGSANQLLASLSMLAVSAWLAKEGKNNKYLLVPMAITLVITLCSLLVTLEENLVLIASGTGSFSTEGIQCIIIILLLGLAVHLTYKGIKDIKNTKKQA